MALRQCKGEIYSITSRFGISLVIFLVLAGLTIAEEVPEAEVRLKATICAVYSLLTEILPLLTFVLFVLAAVVYGIGNLFGPDVRAKATQWAMMCITGAVICLVIFAVGPMIIKSMYGAQFDIDAVCPKG